MAIRINVQLEASTRVWISCFEHWSGREAGMINPVIRGALSPGEVRGNSASGWGLVPMTQHALKRRGKEMPANTFTVTIISRTHVLVNPAQGGDRGGFLE